MKLLGSRTDDFDRVFQNLNGSLNPKPAFSSSVPKNACLASEWFYSRSPKRFAMKLFGSRIDCLVRVYPKQNPVASYVNRVIVTPPPPKR